MQDALGEIMGVKSPTWACSFGDLVSTWISNLHSLSLFNAPISISSHANISVTVTFDSNDTVFFKLCFI